MTPRSILMTMTASEAAEAAPEVIPIILKLKTVDRSVRNLATKLEIYVNPDSQEGINLRVWKAQVLPRQLFGNPDDEESNALASQALLFLISQVARPLFLMDDASPEMLNELPKLDDEIKALLALYLSVGNDIEECIEAYEHSLDQHQFELLENQQVTIFFHNKMAELDSARISPSEQLESLLGKMNDSELFSLETKAKIAKWMRNFPPRLFDQLVSDDMRETASVALCYLLCNILYPSSLGSAQEAISSEFIAFEKELKVILARAMPRGEESVESFIETFERLSIEKKRFDHELALVRESLHVKMSQLHEDANATHLEIVQAFEGFKAQILALRDDRLAQSKEMSDKVEVLTAEFNTFISKMSDGGKALKGVAEKMEIQHAAFKENIHRGQEMLRGLRI